MERDKVKARLKLGDQVSVQFQHTQLGVYLAGAFGLAYIWASSAQGIVDKYHFSKKWFYLYGVLCFFAYLYLRPFVRRGLGSAHRGYLNFYSLYILWLCSALFCHLPSLEALGLDIKADISLALSIAASSLLVLGVLHGLQLLAIHFKWLAPAPGATRQAVWTCIILNSLTLAAACSTYFQLCGNGTAEYSSSSNSDGRGLIGSGFLQEAVCKWYLAPLPTQEYPKFSAWMLYGERSTTDNSTNITISADVGRSDYAAPAPSGHSRIATNLSAALVGPSSAVSSPAAAASAPLAINASALAHLVSTLPAGSAEAGSSSVISPVFTMWITLVALYIINVLADHIAAFDMSAGHISELRRDVVPDHDLALLAALSAAAGKSLRQGAHQLAAAQQQRQQQQHRSSAGRGKSFQLERGRSGDRSSSYGSQRSKSVETHRKSPWSPRFMVERTMVNLLETTSSFSFKAAALLDTIDTKGFPTWQQLQNQGLGGLSSLSKSGLGSKARQIQRAYTSGGAIPPARHHTDKAQPSSSTRLRQQGQQGPAAQEQQQQQVPPPYRGRLIHTRSKSMSSIQSGTASGLDEDDFAPAAPAAQQQVQRGTDADRGSSSSLKGLAAAASDSSGSALQNSLGYAAKGNSSSRAGRYSRRGSDPCSSPFAMSQQQQQQQQQQFKQQQQPQQQQQGQLGIGGFGSVVSLSSPTWGAQQQQQGVAETPTTATAAGRGRGRLLPNAVVGAAGAARQRRGSSNDSARAPSPDQPEPETPHANRSNSSTLKTHRTSDPNSASSHSPGGNSVCDDGDHDTGSTDAGGGTHDDKDLSSPRGSGSKDGPVPPFLDMVPWYSGTSADLFKTMFDLMISLKLFLGRFDMRTMQAATAASMADSFNDTPAEGDGFTYEHFHNKQELWVDFIADTGDGGNPTYTVARALAAPQLVVPVNDVVRRQRQGQQQQQQVVINTGSTARQQTDKGGNGSTKQQQHHVHLPRGDVLLIGGDLAYPNPSRETYESRLFVPFQEAMPPPPHYHPGRLVVHKPDLPPSFGVQEGLTQPAMPAGLSPRSSRTASGAALRAYTGPNAFAIPGNHDWIDGLETFIKQIMHKGWLGGWLLPQEKSYFALRLPAGWWVFGLDLALVGDIDMCQYRYFANVVERRLGPNDNVIIITHEPTWLLEWFWANSSSTNLRQLVRGHLRGRARVHLAGDLHFYMRHSFTQQSQQQQQQQNGDTSIIGVTAEQPAAEAAAAAADTLGSGSATAADAAAEKVAAADELLMQSTLHQSWRPDDDNCCCTGTAAVNEIHAVAGNVGLAAAAAAELNRSRRLSSSSNGSTSSSSSSGVDSCNTPLEPLQTTFRSARDSVGNFANEAAAAGQGSTVTARHGSNPDDDAASPVLQARKSLPRLVIGSPLSRRQSGKPGDHAATNGCVNTTNTMQQAAAAIQRYNSNAAAAAATTNHSPAAAAQHNSLEQQQGPNGLHHTLLDPEHLIVNGLGGAFLHPTHVFSYSRFACLDDEAAAATAATYSTAANKGLLSTVPLSGASSINSLDALALPAAALGSRPHGTLHLGSGAVGHAVAVGRHSSSTAWDPDLHAWHCPMSPSGTSDVWEAPHTALHDSDRLPSVAHWADGTATHCAEPAAAAASSGGGGGSSNSGSGGSAAAAGSGGGIPSAVGVGPAAAAAVCGVSAGVYKCAALFPPADKSLRLGRKNLHLFRFKNSRFDVIGGALYFLSIVSILPRCSAGLALLSATNIADFTAIFLREFTACWYDIFMTSYLSLAVTLLFFLITFGFAKGGGVGAVSGEMQHVQQQHKRLRQQQLKRQQGTSTARSSSGKVGSSKRRSPVIGPLVKLRTGGTNTQVLVALLHAGVHLSLAVVLLLLLELGVEICIKYEKLGSDGLHSMYRWFESYQETHFPDPMGLRHMAHRWSFGLYPWIIQAAMAVYDIPEAVAVARNAVCTAPDVVAGFSSLSRLQVLSYYAGMLAYYWLLAIPAMGFVFGLYLYVCVCWFHVHYDEAFSALRIANFKGLSRLHITKDGDLEIFTLGIDRVPTVWREDGRWYGPEGGGSGKVAGHAAAYPSRWVPAVPQGADYNSVDEGLEDRAVSGDACLRFDKAGCAAHTEDPSMGLKVVDYLKVPRQRAGLTSV